MTTQSFVSFVDDTTIQIRFELGEIDKAQITTDIPEGVIFDEADGYGFTQTDSTLVGRLVGANNEYFMPFDGFTPSAIADLFTWSEVDGVRAAPVDDLSQWQVTVDGVAVDLTAISRKANILETATVGWTREFTTAHNVFLELDAPLAEGAAIEISFNDSDFETLGATFDPDQTISEAIHVNLAGYDPDAAIKMAYLSSWNGFEYDPSTERGGNQVPQDYSAGMTFEVIDEATGTVVLTGQTALAQGLEDGTNFWQNYASAPVLEMDLSSLTAQGSYHVVVDGVGRSQSFEVDDAHWEDVFGLAFKGYYHQRSGTELTAEYTDFVRPSGLTPSDGITVHQTTVKITETSEAWDGSLPKPFEFWEGNLTGETLENAWGGWHDAGDFDRRTQHMETARKLVELHEINTDWSEGFDGNIPESSNTIPDLLDEAIWGTMVFRRLQHEDGGVPGGIESASYGSFGGASFTDGRDLYAYAPDAWSSWEYAATAAKIARALEPYDPTEAAAWLDSAVAAFDWAEANSPTGAEYDNGHYPRSQNIAAAELFETTGEARYHDIFLDTFVYADASGVEWFEHMYEAAFLYAGSDQAGADAATQALALATLQDRADTLIAEGTHSGFGFVSDPYAPYGWGNTATQPTHSSEILTRLHALTGDADLIPVIQQDVDYAFGANPMNMSFVTGLDQLVEGVRQPLEILHSESETLGVAPPPGITLYGEYNIYDYGWQYFHSDMWEDTWPNYYDAPVHESWNGNFGYVPVTEFTVMQGMEDMTFVTGYLAALEARNDAPPSEGTRSETIVDENNRLPWTSYTDTFNAADERIERIMFYDDGRITETSFENGQRVSVRLSDPDDAVNWESKSQSFDSEGRLLERTIRFDTGKDIQATYAEGRLLSKVITDTADAFDFVRFENTYAGGRIQSRLKEMDNGRMILTTFEDGVPVQSVITDTQDVYGWAQRIITYDENGDHLSVEVIQDYQSVEEPLL